MDIINKLEMYGDINHDNPGHPNGTKIKILAAQLADKLTEETAEEHMESLIWILGSESVIEDILAKDISSPFHKDLTQGVIDRIESVLNSL